MKPLYAAWHSSIRARHDHNAPLVHRKECDERAQNFTALRDFHDRATCRMRHVKLRPGVEIDEAALRRLIEAVWRDIKEKVERG